MASAVAAVNGVDTANGVDTPGAGAGAGVDVDATVDVEGEDDDDREGELGDNGDRLLIQSQKGKYSRAITLST